MTLSKPSFLKKRSIEHEVEGEKLRFYGLRVQILADMRAMSKPIARAFTTLFSVGAGSQAKVEKSFKTPVQHRLEKGTPEAQEFEDIVTVDQGEEKVHEAMSVEMHTHLLEQRTAAIDDMIAVFTDPANKYVVGKIIMASLRDHYPKIKEITPAEIDLFMDGKDDDDEDYPGVDASTLVSLLIGVCKANFSWFSDAEGKLKAAVENKLKGALSQQGDPDFTSDSPTTDPG